jgi:hypothetical protein
MSIFSGDFFKKLGNCPTNKMRYLRDKNIEFLLLKSFD